MPSLDLTITCAPTPFGELIAIASRDQGSVHAAGFGPLREVVSQLPAALVSAPLTDDGLPSIADAVAAWVDGDGDALTRVPVSLAGSPFFTEVWSTLRTVPAGEVVSYRELAEMAGRPRAMRAVGTACARNAVGLFVPCHRVIASGGRLGGYGFGGESVKAGLLAHEGVAIAPGPVTVDSRVGGADASPAGPRPPARASAEPRPLEQW